MDYSTPRTKRNRSSSASSSGSSAQSSSSHSLSPPPKFHRATPAATSEFVCHLPPTCHQPTASATFTSAAELERHQLQLHNYICRVAIRDSAQAGQAGAAYNTRSSARNAGTGGMPEGFVSGSGRNRTRECGRVFPDERFLELHHTEVHDSIAKERQAGGAKIFECFIAKPECGKRFSSPANRRKHLKAKHHYPENYFFSITNHGLNQIIQEEGLAASLIRPRRDLPVDQPDTSAIGGPDTVSERDIDHGSSKTSRQANENGSAPRPAGSLRDGGLANDKGMDVDDLAGQLESSLALAFVPAAVRRKGAKPAKSSQAVSEAKG